MEICGWIILAILGIFVYANVGYLLAHWSWNSFARFVSRDRSINSPWWSTNTGLLENLHIEHLLLFPITYLRTKKARFGMLEMHIRTSDDLSVMFNPFVNEFSQKAYKRIMIFVWPLKMLWNTPWVVMYALYKAIAYLPKLIFVDFPRLVTFPTRKTLNINHT